MKKLTLAEENVMMILWNIEKGFLKDFVNAYPEPKPHHNTVATLIQILVSKKYIKYKLVGRSNLYTYTISKEEYLKKVTEDFVHQYFEGDAEALRQYLKSSTTEKLKEKEKEKDKKKSKKKKDKTKKVIDIYKLDEK